MLQVTQPGGPSTHEYKGSIPRYEPPEIPDVPTVTADGPVTDGPESNVKIETEFWETITIAAFLIAAAFLFIKT